MRAAISETWGREPRPCVQASGRRGTRWARHTGWPSPLYDSLRPMSAAASWASAVRSFAAPVNARRGRCWPVGTGASAEQPEDGDDSPHDHACLQEHRAETHRRGVN